MRGTPAMPRYNAMSWGIIPAYAGNTPLLVTGRLKGRDHPRVCGEHSFSQAKGHLVTGSSPRMRGTLYPSRRSARSPGIIPAYAGNTGGESAHVRDIGDHPRVCGEHVRRAGHSYSRWGSSPRMRGTLRRRRCPTGRHGIIPAYAGNTLPAYVRSAIVWDHPRVCGEHVSCQLDGFAVQGSSPRMRGTH